MACCDATPPTPAPSSGEKKFTLAECIEARHLMVNEMLRSGLTKIFAEAGGSSGVCIGALEAFENMPECQREYAALKALFESILALSNIGLGILTTNADDECCQAEKIVVEHRTRLVGASTN